MSTRRGALKGQETTASLSLFYGLKDKGVRYVPVRTELLDLQAAIPLTDGPFVLLIHLYALANDERMRGARQSAEQTFVTSVAELAARRGISGRQVTRHLAELETRLSLRISKPTPGRLVITLPSVPSLLETFKGRTDVETKLRQRRPELFENGRTVELAEPNVDEGEDVADDEFDVDALDADALARAGLTAFGWLYEECWGEAFVVVDEARQLAELREVAQACTVDEFGNAIIFVNDADEWPLFREKYGIRHERPWPGFILSYLNPILSEVRAALNSGRGKLAEGVGATVA